MRKDAELRLGLIGLSDGNGHPYSWSAIINGYDEAVMAKCPFPVIPAYLAERSFPEDQLVGARVTHIWTQDESVSSHIAAATRIPNIVKDFRHMVANVDGILLARDDAKQHQIFASPFLEAGLPVYIDKPVALNKKALDELFEIAMNPWQVFSCSALRFSKEFQLTEEEQRHIGKLKHIMGETPKSWEHYAVHLIDPVIHMMSPEDVIDTHVSGDNGSVDLSVIWRNGCTGLFRATGKPYGEISLVFVGEHASIRKVFHDAFTAFRAALQSFVRGVNCQQSETSYDELSRIVQLIYLGGQGR